MVERISKACKYCTECLYPPLTPDAPPDNASSWQAVGGEDPTKPLQSPQEMQMREHVMNVLQKNGVEMLPAVSDPMLSNPSCRTI